jgi:hypothetical protein
MLYLFLKCNNAGLEKLSSFVWTDVLTHLPSYGLFSVFKSGLIVTGLPRDSECNVYEKNTMILRENVLTDLHILRLPDCEEVVFRMLSVCTDAPLASA